MLEAETVAHPFTIKLGLQTNQHNIVVRRSTKKKKKKKKKKLDTVSQLAKVHSSLMFRNEDLTLLSLAVSSHCTTPLN